MTLAQVKLAPGSFDVQELVLCCTQPSHLIKAEIARLGSMYICKGCFRGPHPYFKAAEVVSKEAKPSSRGLIRRANDRIIIIATI